MDEGEEKRIQTQFNCTSSIMQDVFGAADADNVKCMRTSQCSETRSYLSGIPADKLSTWPNLLIAARPNNVTLDAFCAWKVVWREGASWNMPNPLWNIKLTPWTGHEQPMPMPIMKRDIHRIRKTIRAMWIRDGALDLDGLVPGYGVRVRVFCRQFIAGNIVKQLSPSKLLQRQNVVAAWSTLRATWIAAAVCPRS